MLTEADNLLRTLLTYKKTSDIMKVSYYSFVLNCRGR